MTSIRLAEDCLCTGGEAGSASKSRTCECEPAAQNRPRFQLRSLGTPYQVCYAQASTVCLHHDISYILYLDQITSLESISFCLPSSRKHILSASHAADALTYLLLDAAHRRCWNSRFLQMRAMALPMPGCPWHVCCGICLHPSSSPSLRPCCWCDPSSRCHLICLHLRRIQHVKSSTGASHCNALFRTTLHSAALQSNLSATCPWHLDD